MATLWVICGAGRGAGKTHLALGLCAALPNSVYAKLGCGRPKLGRPENFFRKETELASFVDARRSAHEHIVVESNAWARRGTGDIIIFVDRVFGCTPIRDDADQLRSNSHVRVCPGGKVRDWRRALRGKLGDGVLRDKVCDLLAAQKRFVSKPGLTVRSKVWFVAGDEHAFGSGLTSLLQNVDRLGTLAEAARSAKISYRRAWDLIKSAEKHLGKRIIIPQSGGVGGGRSILSPHGRRLLDVFKRVNDEVAAYADTRFVAHFYGEDNDERLSADDPD